MIIKIRNFGNDTDCDINELLNELKDYSGLSVSLQYKRPSGMNALLFIDPIIGKDGDIIIKDAYTDEVYTIQNIKENFGIMKT
ncbi:hypothetical protein [Moritella sp. F3]|uniref:hypothetical protein n=1 Tax=Moritella sp. F3 TaxID=2718882 RepID=UPI0018E17FAC|nr:hypothetical protein [Moritella sp. F3]GIC77057.1 hypothetical protein FMO001_17840 [Moritella sp. F1]GIC82176.1 hypothetical protein FMO003_24570 [Moritella sp. F3]